MEKIEVNAEHLVTLHSKHQWVTRIPDCLPPRKREDQLLFVDSYGNVLTIGKDFAAAQEMDTYPVKVYRLIRVSELTQTPTP